MANKVKCLKYTIAGMNIIFMAVGLTILAVMTWSYTEGYIGDIHEGQKTAELKKLWPILAAAVWASWVVFLGGTTLLSVFWVWQWRLGMLGLLLLATVALEATLVGWAALHVPELRVALRQRLLDMMQLEYGNKPPITHAIDTIQRELKCCGVDSIRDWQDSSWSRGLAPPPTGAPSAGAPSVAPPAPRHASPLLDLSISAPPTYYKVPASCCDRSLGACGVVEVGVGAGAGAAAGVWGAGCGARVEARLWGTARALALLAGAVFALQLLTLLLLVVYFFSVKPKHKA